jgi:hypothetical protein
MPQNLSSAFEFDFNDIVNTVAITAIQAQASRSDA